MAISQVVKPDACLIRTLPVQTLIRFRVLRDGAVTPAIKRVRVVRDWGTGSQLDMAFYTIGDGEFTDWLYLPLQTLVDQGGWAVVGIDDTAPRVTVAAYMQIEEGGTYSLNITSGSGAEATDPALVDASVRIERLPAEREVVVIERPATGEWRIAGRGQTTSDGHVSIELGVTGGRVFAVALDEFGLAYSPGLVVLPGQRIRPSVFAGVLYDVTEAGTLPASEPEWWPITVTESRELGTARAVAVRYYRPLAHGPISVELT